MIPTCDFKDFDVCIYIEYKKHRIVIKLRSAYEYLKIETSLSENKLIEYRNIFYDNLENFLNQILSTSKGFDLKFSDISKPLQDLHEIGRVKYDELFEYRRYDVDDFFKKVAPNWNNSYKSDNFGYRPPLIRIKSELDYPLPWEFFPVFDTSEIYKMSDTKELYSNASRFLGFSTIISRVFKNHPPVIYKILDNCNNLGVRFFQNITLNCSREERDYFADKVWFDLRGVWPSSVLPKKRFISELVTQLRKPLDQIHHFTCHCNTKKDSTEDYVITLACKNKNWLGLTASKREVNIRELRGEFSKLPRISNKVTPLVFLNACGSSKITAEGVNSFPSFFIKRARSRSVIGTETPIPDKFAAEFSKHFYLKLIQGKSLGEALYGARWDLLIKRKNPLGILYTAYGDSGLHVRRPYPNAIL
ncbi:CHAT domain-containing protein [Chloroflexota bacterium]